MTAMNWLTTLLLTFALPLGALTTPLARRRETGQEAGQYPFPPLSPALTRTRA